MQFADVVSPMALKENLATISSGLAKGESEPQNDGVMSNVMVQRAITLTSCIGLGGAARGYAGVRRGRRG